MKPDAPGDFLDARHFEPLALLDDPHEHAGIEQGVVRAGIEPRRAASQPSRREASPISQVRAVEVGDLQLAAGGGLNALAKAEARAS